MSKIVAFKRHRRQTLILHEIERRTSHALQSLKAAIPAVASSRSGSKSIKSPSLNMKAEAIQSQEEAARCVDQHMTRLAGHSHPHPGSCSLELILQK